MKLTEIATSKPIGSLKFLDKQNQNKMKKKRWWIVWNLCDQSFFLLVNNEIQSIWERFPEYVLVVYPIAPVWDHFHWMNSVQKKHKK